MRSLAELIDDREPAWPLVEEWISASPHPVEVLPPADSRGAALLDVQVTTRSPMGAIVYETGGILVDHGWLRILGSGHPRLTRSLAEWNRGRGSGFFLVADDAIGGFFAINGGALGTDVKNVYYFAPDSLRWESLERGYSDFLSLAFSAALGRFYADVRWPGWEHEVAALHGDRCLMPFPPLWTAEGRAATVHRGEVPVSEAWGVQMDFRQQLDGLA